MIFVFTEFNFVNRIHFCVTKVTFVRQNSLLSCHRSYSLLFYLNHSPIGCNTFIFGEGKPRPIPRLRESGEKQVRLLLDPRLVRRIAVTQKIRSLIRTLRLRSKQNQSSCFHRPICFEK